MIWSIKMYSRYKTNLIRYISTKTSMKSSSSIQNESSGTGDQSDTGCASENFCIETDLVLKNGTPPPHWFVEAYREHRIPHDVADILTQRYFISPPQVEETSLECSYLVVEPIVRAVYTILWQEVNDQENSIRKGEHQCVNTHPHGVECGIQDVNCFSLTSDGGHDSDDDVIIEEDENEELECTQDSEVEDTSHFEEHLECISESALPENWECLLNSEINQTVQHEDNLECFTETKHLGSDTDENMEETTEVPVVDDHRTSQYSLKWYLRKGKHLWLKKLRYLPKAKAETLPYLSEVDGMSVYDRKVVFYSVLESDCELVDLDLPGDLELILAFVIYWFRNSRLSLKDCHILAVLVCVFMYYIIDGRIGKVRTRKAFEEVERCKTVVTNLLQDKTYSSPSASVKDLLANLSEEECLVAGSNLFVFHHMNDKINNKYFNRITVHAFSEFQACIYFMQMLNSLLCAPFPMLCVEHLWGGTFCYNVFYDLKRKTNPVLRIAELLGRGTCLAKLFLKIFKKLCEVLRFKKFSEMVEQVEGLKVAKKKRKEKKPDGENKETVKSKKGKKKKNANQEALQKKELVKSENKVKKNVDHNAAEKSEILKPEKEGLQLLGNRFAGLVVESESSSGDED